MPETDGDRIATLRQRCLDRKHLPKHSPLPAAAESLRASEAEGSWQVRQGRVTRDCLKDLRLAVDDLELLMGRLAPRQATDAEIEAAREYLKGYPVAGGQTGHCELDLSRLFAMGIDGMREDLARRREAVAEDPDRRDALGSFLDAMEGFSGLLDHAAETAEKAMAGASEARSAELQAMARSCRRVAHRPPETYREALQLLWMADLALMAIGQASLVVPGRLDRRLWPYYQADRAAGRITEDQALELIECLYLLINELVPDGLAMSVMVGGRDGAGNDATNELSHLCLEALRRTRLIYPTVGICWHEGTPDALTDLAVELISDGVATPAFFGDETIQRGLRRLGASRADACNYINSTCVEITPVGASNVWVASPYFNLCGLLRDEIAVQAGAHVSAPDFGTFLATYEARVGFAISDAVERQNQLRRRRRRFGRKPLQSVLTRDCIARGRDIDDGGALYNWVECSFVGLANLADSLNVIRHEVFEQGRLDIEQLHALLESDLAGAEDVRSRWLNSYAKYGNDDLEVDGLVIRLAATLEAHCGTHRMDPDAAPLVPGCFCWVMHERLGRETGATPDGRRAGAAFADGAGPAQGRERHGPTAAVLSTTSWDHAPMIGGVAHNMKFPRSLLQTPAARRKLRDLIVTFLRRGGFEAQVNVVDADRLRAALERPEAHRDLVVRIGGYCDYFTRLSAGMQQEILQRTEFAEV